MTEERTRPWLALLVTFVAQLVVGFVAAIAPVVAPSVAPQVGVSPERVGLFSALVYFSAMVFGVLVSPWIVWAGPVRFTQILLLATGAGAALATLGSVGALLAAAVAIGAAVGCTNPAFNAILGRHVPLGS